MDSPGYRRITGIDRSHRLFLIVTILAIGATTVAGLAQPSATPVEKASPPMQQFVLLFRPSPKPLSEANLKRRTDAVLTWAREQNERGRKLDPRALGKEHEWIGPDTP